MFYQNLPQSLVKVIQISLENLVFLWMVLITKMEIPGMMDVDCVIVIMDKKCVH